MKLEIISKKEASKPMKNIEVILTRNGKQMHLEVIGETPKEYKFYFYSSPKPKDVILYGLSFREEEKERVKRIHEGHYVERTFIPVIQKLILLEKLKAV